MVHELKLSSSLLEAIQSYDRAIELKPDDANAYYNKGHKYNEAMESYDKVISLRPDNYHYYLRKGNVLRMLGRNDEAIVLYNDALPSFDEAISKAEDPKELLIEKSRLLKEAGRLHESVECLEKVIALDPEDISSLGHLEDTYLLLRDYDKVIELSDVVKSRGLFLDSLLEYVTLCTIYITCTCTIYSWLGFKT